MGKRWQQLLVFQLLLDQVYLILQQSLWVYGGDDGEDDGGDDGDNDGDNGGGVSRWFKLEDQNPSETL